MNRLNLSPECFSKLREANCAVSTLREACVPEHLCLVLYDILRNDCFLVDSSRTPSTINRSIQQAEPVVDLLFTFFVAGIFNSIRSALLEAGIGVPSVLVSILVFGDRHPGTLPDVSYIDDGAVTHEIYDKDIAIVCFNT